jgi:hypothetical protein
VGPSLHGVGVWRDNQAMGRATWMARTLAALMDIAYDVASGAS